MERDRTGARDEVGSSVHQRGEKLRRLLAVFIGAMLVTAACGGDVAPEVTEADVPRTAAGAVAIIERYGTDDGIDAVIFAFEHGYESAEIQDAAIATTLSADGLIDGVSPNGPPLGLVEQARANGSAMAVTGVRASVRFQTELRPVDIVRSAIIELGRRDDNDTLRNTTRDVARAWIDRPESRAGAGAAGIALVFGLTEQGYSMDQVVEAIILGYLVTSTDTDNSFSSTECLTLFVPGGAFVPPNQPKPGCEFPAESEPEEDAPHPSSTTMPDASAATTTSVADTARTYTGEVEPDAEAIIGFDFALENSIVIDRTGNDFSVTAAFSYQFADEGSPQCSGTSGFYFDGTATLEEGSDTLVFGGTRSIVYDWQGSCAEQRSPDPNPQTYVWTLEGDTISGNFHGGAFTASR